MHYLESAWRRQGIDFDQQKQHVRCFAHILNLVVQVALAALEWRDEVIYDKTLNENDEHLSSATTTRTRMTMTSLRP